MIYLTGDVHGAYNIRQKLESYIFPEGQKMTKNDVVIICGDFGIPWSYPTDERFSSDIESLKWLDSQPWTTLFVDGNHENFDMLYQFPQAQMFGGKAHKLAKSIFHLQRGEIYTIQEKSFLALGGALSIDKDYRLLKEHHYNVKLWWEQEMWTSDEQKHCIENLKKHNNNVDYVIAHTCPQNIVQQILNILPHQGSKLYDSTSGFFEELVTHHIEDFKHWFFGHFHINTTINQKFTCLYDEIIDINDGRYLYE